MTMRGADVNDESLDKPDAYPTLRRLWWLHPAYLFTLVIGTTMFAAWMQTDAAFRLYGTPKFVGTIHLLMALGAIAVFAVGYRLAMVTGTKPRGASSSADALVEKWFWLCMGLTLFGYAVWLSVGLKNGFSVETLHEFFSSEDGHLAERIRDDMFYTVQGVTTCTQFGVAALPLGLWLYFRGRARLIWPIAGLLGLAAIRALLFSERLALIELFVPAIVVILRMRFLGRPLLTKVHSGLQLAPVVGIAALLIFFASFEYFRSWRFYRQEFDSYAQFTLWRVSGYYTTAHNNGAMALETQPPYPLPYSTLQMFWRAPGLSKTPLGYVKLSGIDPQARHQSMLEHYGTAELNNEGGVFQPALDYGLGGYFVFWCACGFVAGRFYRSFLAGSLAGVTVYPLIFLAILETPRFLYLTYPRVLPALVALGIVTLLAQQARRRTPAHLPIPATA
jgi:hypothetical protein